MGKFWGMTAAPVQLS